MQTCLPSQCVKEPYISLISKGLGETIILLQEMLGNNVGATTLTMEVKPCYNLTGNDPNRAKSKKKKKISDF